MREPTVRRYRAGAAALAAALAVTLMLAGLASGQQPSGPTGWGLTAPAPAAGGQVPGSPQPPVQQGMTRGGEGIPAVPGQAPSGPASPVAPEPGQQAAEAPVAAPAVPPSRRPSPIEAALEASVPQQVSRKLEQFGYGLFRAPASTFAPVDNVPVGPNYILGPGDGLTVYVYGLVESVFNETVDRNGEIFLPKVGPIRVWGLPFSKAEELITQRLARVFSGFNTTLTMGRLRTIKVFVVGEVQQPGGYTLSALSTISNALYAAGGPTKVGTLRDIRLIRDNQPVVAFDLYDFLLRGDKTNDVRLEAGDTIFVPPIGPVVGVAGFVKRPAIYEMKEAIRVSEVLKLAGGVTPFAYLQRVQVERVRVDKEKYVVDLDLSRLFYEGDRSVDLQVKDGDLIKVFPIDTRIYNTVQLEGFVRHPGEYELKPGMRLADLLPPDAVLPQAYLDRVEVVRITPELETEVHSVDAKQLWRGDPSQNLVLRELDRVVVKSELRPEESVTVQGEVRRPGTYTIRNGERLSSVLARAGGYMEDAYLKGAVFTRQRVKEEEQKRLEEFIRAQEAALLTQAAAAAEGLTSLSAAGAKDEGTLQAQALTQRREMLRVLASQVVLGRVVVRLDEPDRIAGTADDILLEHGDVLTIPKKPSSVLVVGAVRNPTAILHKEGESTEYYISRAGGFSKQAEKKEMYIVRADGSAVTSFTKLRTLEPGDTIVAPADTDPKVRALPITRDVATILGQFALSVGVIAALF